MAGSDGWIVLYEDYVLLGMDQNTVQAKKFETRLELDVPKNRPAYIDCCKPAAHHQKKYTPIGLYLKKKPNALCMLIYLLSLIETYM